MRQRGEFDATARLRHVLAHPAGPGHAQALLAAVGDISLDVGRAALRRLVPLAGPEEIEGLRSSMLELDIGIVGDVAAALRTLGDAAATSVAIEALGSPSPSRRQKAAIALRELQAADARNSLREALGDETVPVRRLAVEALERLPGDAGSVVALRRMLVDPDASVRSAAIRALALLDPDAPQTLDASAQDDATDVREELGRAACTLDAETVESLLDDRAAEVREAAVRALVHCPDAVPLSRLLDSLGDESWHVRRAACDAVAAAGGDAAGHALIDALLDSRIEVRGRALVALERLYGDRLEAALEGNLAQANNRLRGVLIGLLGGRGRGEVALRYLRDPAPEVRIAVVHALAVVDSLGAEQALRALAADSDPAVRNATAVALDKARRRT
ncbi:MAG TPA: HEAT repeat domain-containing protein [Gaiellaceae bacterium]|nr:HEAT repeat domain-containing protein [Gaiellaceae bacterium]